MAFNDAVLLYTAFPVALWRLYQSGPIKGEGVARAAAMASPGMLVDIMEGLAFIGVLRLPLSFDAFGIKSSLRNPLPLVPCIIINGPLARAYCLKCEVII